MKIVEKKIDKIEISKYKFKEYVCYAIRYAFDRHSYARGTCKELIKEYYDLIPKEVLRGLLEDLDRYIRVTTISGYLDDYMDMEKFIKEQMREHGDLEEND